MPPKGDPLTEDQVALLRAWIDQGANWPENLAGAGERVRSEHWAFQPVERAEVPAVTNAAWVRNPIDAFILKRLEAEGIAPSPEADRITLLRRLCLDLTGLPPTPEQVDAFLNDTSPDAYERLVERLLASPRFGEQWARHWLDLARYADSDGYEKDLYRPHAWRWRDWVINAINRDQPFDEFTIDQLAGDLRPDANTAQVVATGFHRNTLLNREGGADLEEDRNKIVVDRVDTVGTVWLGLTVGCAECHSHKYDPITQREYYQLFAFFNSTDDRDIAAPLPSQQEAIRQTEAAYREAQVSYNDPGHWGDDEPAFQAWVETAATLPDIWTTLESYELPTFGANNGANLYPQEDGSFLVTGMVNNNTHYIFMGNTPLKDITGIRVEAMADPMLPNAGPGWADDGHFVISEVQVEASPLSDVSRLQTFTIDKARADFSQEGFDVARSIDGDDKTGWSAHVPTLPLQGVDRCAVYALKDRAGFDSGTRLKISLVQHDGNSTTLGRVRVMITTADPATLAEQTIPGRIREIARIPASERTPDQETTLRRYYQITFAPEAPRLAEITQALHARNLARGAVKAQVLSERSTPRPTHIHLRGNFLDEGPQVSPGTPAVLHALEARGERPDRLDLARWLIEPENPLTARVTVNRIWRHLFGEGLVPSVADFGSQGEPPSHPELLDWLASEFVARGWSRKAMITLIVTSSTYRQSSAHREELRSIDARNRLLARQNRFRLIAENVRDQYLAAGGLLDGRIGGESVPADAHRRGLYVQLKRSFPEPMLVTFDAPSTTLTCPLRERSNTPLQALTLLNDPLYVACARGLARRAVAEVPENDIEKRLRHAFQLALTRPPSEEDLSDLRTLFDQVRSLYEANPEAAAQVAADAMPDTMPRPEAAAWVVVGRTILNLDEVVTRE